MFKEKLLIGQYYPVDSPIHRLDARAKILASLIYMITLFVVNNWWGYALMAAVFILYTAISRLPMTAVWRGLKVIIYFSILTMVFNFFFYDQGEIIWQYKALILTDQGILHGIAMGLRLLLLVAFASLLTLTTTPIQLTDGLEGLFKPLTVIKFPAHEIAMMTSIALRFIPTILEEFDRIILAQRARGATISQGSFLNRVKALIPLMVPLFVAAFRRAEELAQAMEAKCYRGGEGRSRWKVAKWHQRDSEYLLVFTAIVVVAVLLRGI